MMPRKRDESDSRTQGIAKGWIKESVQVPLAISDTLSLAASHEGHGGKKILATVGIGLALGVPEKIRKRLYNYVLVNARDPQSIDPESIWRELVASIRDENGGHYMDRILDPAFTPKPDETPGDVERRREAG